MLIECTQCDKKNIPCDSKNAKKEIKILHNIIEEFQEKFKKAKPEEENALNEELRKQLQKNMFTKDGINHVHKYFTLQNISFEQEKSNIQTYMRFDNLCVLKKDFLLIHFLINHMNHCITGELIQCKEQREGLSVVEFDELLEKLEFEHKKKPSKNQAKKNCLSEFLEKAEPACSISLIPASLKKKRSISPSIDKMQIYLDNQEKNKQLNGCLSQSIENYLSQAKSYLYQTMQGKEVYDHVLLGASALEHMAQAIHEGRRDHVVLGFRSALIHCHFAIEQALCQIILQQTGVYVNSHNLVDLAKQLGKNTKKSKTFLEEVRVHLWFHYPEDYRLYFAYNKNTPKAFSLLNVLFQPKIHTEKLQEAMHFSFEKYCQTLEFIVDLLEIPLQNASDLINKIELLQSQLSQALHVSSFKKHSISPFIKKLRKAEGLLNTLNGFVYIKDFEEGWLFAAFNTITGYLRLIKISLETPQEASEHSLQKFIQVETLLNMDKVFKHLFRAMSILRLGEDNHAHDIKEFFPLIEELQEEDRNLLKKINLKITHHYLHKCSSADVKKNMTIF